MISLSSGKVNEKQRGQVKDMPENFKRISAEEFADLDYDEVTLLDLREEY